MTSLGEAGGSRNKARCFENLSSWVCGPPIFRCVAKMHKEASPEGIPKSIPLVDASIGLITSLGEIVSGILESIAKTKVCS